MTIRIDVHLHGEADTLRRIIREELTPMSAALDRLTTEVAESKAVTESAAKLIEGLAQQIRDAADDPVKLAALADELDAQSNALADAVSANTTPEPPPVAVG